MDVVIFSDVNGALGFGRYAGAYRVASELRTAGFSVQIVEFFADLTLSQIQQITDKYIDRHTLFVGFATTLFIKNPDKGTSVNRQQRSHFNFQHFPQDIDYVQEMFAIFKRKNPNIKIVVGGSKANFTTLPGVDYWVWSQADNSVVALARHLKEGAPLLSDAGVHGRVISTKHYPYDDFNKSKILWREDDLIFQGEHLPLEIARGCIFKCAFCAFPLNGKKPGDYIKSTDILRDELLYNFDHFGTTGYMMCDDTYNDSPEKVQALRDMFVSLPFQVEWSAFARVDIINKYREMREQLFESGIRSVFFGIETFHQVAGAKIGKGLDPERVKDTLYYLKEGWGKEVVITASFIAGLPGEPEESIWETVEWLMRDDCPLDGFSYVALNIRERPNSEDPAQSVSKMTANPEKYGYTKTADKPEEASYAGWTWQNEYMDQKRAKELVAEIEEVLSTKKTLADFAFYSRLRNLGYSHDEGLSKRENDVNFITEADQRKSQMRDAYLARLLA